MIAVYVWTAKIVNSVPMKVFNTLQEAIDSIGYGFCFICEAKHEFPNVKCDLMIGDNNV
jgi:hypothetical protein